jgi:hypothetical protein
LSSLVDGLDLARHHDSADLPSEVMAASHAMIDLSAQWRLPC